MAANTSANDDHIPSRRRTAFFQRPTLSGFTHKHNNSSPSPTDAHSRVQGLRMKDRSSSWLSQWSSKSSDVDGEGDAYTRETIPHSISYPMSPVETRLSIDKSSLLTLKSAQLTINTRCASEDSSQGVGLDHAAIVYHGEVKTINAKWRTTREYLVLTEDHLLRFKSQTDALIAFTNSVRDRDIHSGHNMSPIVTSPTDRHPPSYIADTQQGQRLEKINRIPLSSVIAMARLQDVDTPCALMLHILTGDSEHTASWVMQLASSAERDQWEEKIGASARVALLTRMQTSFCIIYALDDVPRSPNVTKKGMLLFHRMEVEEYCIVMRTSTSTEPTRINLINVTSVALSPTENSLTLQASIPFHRRQTFELVTVQAPEIITLIDQRLQALRPYWSIQPYVIKGQNTLIRVATTTSETIGRGFDYHRTLTAYCSGYSQDAGKINYKITGGAGCLQFLLLPSFRGPYNSFELLAILRSLYFATDIQSISFSGIPFDQMNALVDYDNLDHFKAASGVLGESQAAVEDLIYLGLFVREIFAIIATNPSLRQLDLSHPAQSSKSRIEIDCGVPQAVYTLFVNGVSNINWLMLGGRSLSRNDLQFLYLLADQPDISIQGLDVSSTGLNQHDATQLLIALQSQSETLEYLNLADNGSCLNQCSFDGYMLGLHHLMSLNLSNLQLSKAIKDPLLSSATLQNWRLRELNLNDTFVSEATVHALCSYLKQDHSLNLTSLYLEGCELTASSIALLLKAATQEHDPGRRLGLFMGRNPISIQHDAMVDAIKFNNCTNMLSLDRTEYQEQDLRNLFDALRHNTNLESLGLSRIRSISSPYLKSPTLVAIQGCCAANTSIRDIDLSSASTDSNMDQGRTPPGITHALKGLVQRQSLRTLNLDYQRLGSEGSLLLASIIENNPNLCEVYCEQASITLDGIEAIVSVLKTHFSLTYMSDMEDSKLADLEEIGEGSRRRTKLEGPPNRAMQVLNGFEGKITTKRLHRRRRPTYPPTPLQRNASDDDIARRWEEKQTLLFEFLERNRRIAAGDLDIADFQGLTIKD